MSRTIAIQPLTPDAFAPFGDVLDTKSTPDKLINQGMCERHHDRAALDFTDGKAGISVFDAKPRDLPYALDMMERHPGGSQAFVPMHSNPYLVIIAPDAGNVPGVPLAFEASAGQAINFHRNTWHGVLTPLHHPGVFAVIDRIGAGDNLDEYWFERPWIIERAA